MKKILIAILLISFFQLSYAQNTPQEEGKPEKKNTQPPSPEQVKLKAILGKIHDATKALQSCQSDLSYLYIQDPDLLDSRTLRTGKLYYQKEEKRSQLRISFETTKEDDFEARKEREEYLFDGVWLTKIDFKTKQVDLYQQTTKEKPIDVFELINHNFPLVGFSGVDTLEIDFEVSLAENEPNKPILMHLTTKNDSKFKDEYKKIDFWADPNTYLPVRIKAYSTQDDIYDIRFSDTKMNKKLKNAVFTIETPANFRKNIEPLKTESSTKGK